MRLRERNDPEPGPEGSGGETERLLRLRQAAQALLHAGDAAIERVLSGDSEKFLRENRQEGGQ